MDTAAITDSIISNVTTPQNAPSEQEGIDQPIETLVKDDDMSKRIAILAKKEKSILDNQRSYQQKIKELEERESRLGKYSKFDDLNDDNAIELLREKGLNFEKIQEKWLSQLGDDDIDPIQRQLKELTTKLSKKDEEYAKLLEEKLSERDNVKKQQEIEQQSQYYNQELKSFISENAEKYDLVSTFDAADEVFKVIKDVYLKTAERGEPKLLTFEDAANLYEEKLAELVKGMSKSKKVMQLLGVSSTEDDITAQLLGQKTIDDSFTLTSSKGADGMTQKEREKAAAQMFEQMIKSS
jgi:hypothetical protein